jgi:hypothetical protein
MQGVVKAIWLPIRVALGLLPVALLGGCGAQDQSPNGATAVDSPQEMPAPQTPFVTAGDEPLVDCGGGLAFKVFSMRGGIDSQVDVAVIVAALQRLVSEAGIDAPRALQGVDLEGGPWFVLNETNTQMEIATGPWGLDGPGKNAMVVALVKTDDAWRASGWGDCSLAPVAPPVPLGRDERGRG